MSKLWVRVKNGVIIDSNLKSLIFWTLDEFRVKCQKQGWTVEEL